MEHADDLVVRIIFLEGSPRMELDPLHIGKTVPDILQCDFRLERATRALYEEAATHCHAVQDYVSRDLFEKLLHEKEEHIDFLETQLDLVDKLGLPLYAQHQWASRVRTDEARSRAAALAIVCAMLPVAAFPRSSDRITLITPQNTRRRK